MASAPLLSVEDALARLLAGVVPLTSEAVPVADAHNRVLSAPLAARLTQPPFAASAMDGYAVRAADTAALPAQLTVRGEAAAGRRFDGQLKPGTAVRIFTGAPLPEGADAVVIQEDTVRDGDAVIVKQAAFVGENVRARGNDFEVGAALLTAGRRLTSRDLILAAGAGYGTMPVARRPSVAILATGDELVPPGTVPGDGQIVSSIPAGLSAMIVAAGGEARPIGIARDTLADLDHKIAGTDGADILVTIGGASVGDHDLVQQALTARGLDLDFWRIAMRPGKPLMVGRLGEQRVLGLPGNPVSATLCAQVFLLPLIRALQGAPAALPTRIGILAEPLAANGPRQHYMRARILAPGAEPTVTPFSRQDSSLVALLAAADCLIVLPPHAPELPAGTRVTVMDFED